MKRRSVCPVGESRGFAGAVGDGWMDGYLGRVGR